MKKTRMMRKTNAPKGGQQKHSFIMSIRKSAKRLSKERARKVVKRSVKIYKKILRTAVKVFCKVVDIIGYIAIFYGIYRAVIGATGITDFLVRFWNVFYN